MRLALQQGFRDARQTLGASWPIVAVGVSWVCIAVAGLLERPVSRGSTTGSSEPSLIEAATFGIVLPLASYALSSRLGGTRDEIVAASWARHGASRRLYALGRIGFSVVLGSLLVTASGLWALALRGTLTNAPPFGTAQALSTIVLVAVLGAASYALTLGLATLIGGGVGRALYLVGDWALGSGVGIAALPWPRSHLRSLLGGPAVLGMPAWQAGQFLLCLTLASALLYSRRLPR